MFGGGASEVEAADAIEISTPEELQKIGKDAAYPLSGDYVLKNDLDMAGSVFTPIGGIEGEKGTRCQVIMCFPAHLTDRGI